MAVWFSIDYINNMDHDSGNFQMENEATHAVDEPDVQNDAHEDDVDGIEDMVHDVFMGTNVNFDSEEPSNNDPQFSDVHSGKFHRLLRDAQVPLYPGCKISKLNFVVKMLHIKTMCRMSNKSFDMMIELFKDALPIENTLPKSHYEAKSLMRDLGLGYVCIHACINDCVLFWKDLEGLDECPKCGKSRWKYEGSKGKKIPQKILRYFPLKPRLQRLFMSSKIAEDMRWHKDVRVHEENKLRHPADSIVWKEFDEKYEWFAQDPRNVRLALASDGFNPFGNMSNSYSMWPVIAIPYNLPPWMCMTEPFMFMTLLIPGPKSPGDDIDVYMRPVIDELKELWSEGVRTYDAFSKQTFQLHAGMLWTINDFPAYANLSGWSTKGKLACPNCNKETDSLYLKHGTKISYMGHRRFLPANHNWRKRTTLFNGLPEHRLPPKEISGDDVLEQLSNIRDVTFGKGSKKRKRTPIELNWTKKSIFFELPYYRTHKLRHNLDVMHIAKNVCDNILGTLMNIEGKTKDNVKSRLDLEQMGLRKELHLIPKGDSYSIPHAWYTFIPNEKQSFCEWMKIVKFPDGYASNISRCVNIVDYKISGMKSHDCYVFLQRLLPVGIRGLLRKDVSSTLTELGLFFKDLCSRTLDIVVLDRLEKDIVIILCKLERIFPPSFFDVMVHLLVHLPREAKLGGPVQFRWMFSTVRQNLAVPVYML